MIYMILYPHSNNSCLTVAVTVSVHQESYDGHDRYTVNTTGNFKITNLMYANS